MNFWYKEGLQAWQLKDLKFIRRADSCIIIITNITVSRQSIHQNDFTYEGKTSVSTKYDKFWWNEEISSGALSTTLSGTNVYCVLARLSGNTLFNSSVRGKLLPNVRQLYPKNSHGTLFIYLTSSVALISSQLSKKV